MNADQFCEAIVDLYDRAARLNGSRAARMRDYIVDSVTDCAPQIDERLAGLHRQLTLVDIMHQMTRVECQATMAVG